jgi:hypothetical protein
MTYTYSASECKTSFLKKMAKKTTLVVDHKPYIAKTLSSPQTVAHAVILKELLMIRGMSVSSAVFFQS